MRDSERVLGERVYDPVGRATACLSALASPVRLRIVLMLAEAGEDGAAMSKIIKDLSLYQSNASSHLKVLMQAGLVHRRQKGSYAFFSLNAQQVKALLDGLAAGLLGGSAGEMSK